MRQCVRVATREHYAIFEPCEVASFFFLSIPAFFEAETLAIGNVLPSDWSRWIVRTLRLPLYTFVLSSSSVLRNVLRSFHSTFETVREWFKSNLTIHFQWSSQQRWETKEWFCSWLRCSVWCFAPQSTGKFRNYFNSPINIAFVAEDCRTSISSYALLVMLFYLFIVVWNSFSMSANIFGNCSCCCTICFV